MDDIGSSSDLGTSSFDIDTSSDLGVSSSNAKHSAKDRLQRATEAMNDGPWLSGAPKMSFSDPERVRQYRRAVASPFSQADNDLKNVSQGEVRSHKSPKEPDEMEQALRDLEMRDHDNGAKSIRKRKSEQLGAYMEMSSTKQAAHMAVSKSNALVRDEVSMHPIPVWRYLSYRAPAGMRLNPNRRRTRDYLFNNAFGLVLKLVPTAFMGWIFAMLVLVVGSIFVDFPAVVEDYLWIACAIVVYLRHLEENLDPKARKLGRDDSRYIPLPSAPKPITLDPDLQHRRHLELLADATPSDELRRALMRMEQMLLRWEHSGASGMAKKRNDHIIRTLAEACATMHGDRDLMHSEADQQELLETVRIASESLNEALNKDTERRSNDFGWSLRALRRQIGGGSRKD